MKFDESYDMEPVVWVAVDPRPQGLVESFPGPISLDLFRSPKHQRIIKYVFPYIQAISQLCYRGL